MKLFLKVLLLSKNHFKPISEKRLCKKHLPFIKRIFKFCPASMTMEAAVVLPLFFFFFLDLTSSIEMIRLHGNFQMALCDVGNTISVYGALGKEIQEEYLHEVDIAPVSAVTNFLLSYTLVKERVVGFLGESYLEHSPLTYGTAGLSFFETDILTGNRVSIAMQYPVKSFVGLGGTHGFYMVNRYVGHLWTGYDFTENALNESDDVKVYLTENSEVYHLKTECTHLLLSVTEIPFLQIEKMRNEKREKYTPCAYCVGKGEVRNVAFIGPQGERYHFDRRCQGLRRYFWEESLSKVMHSYRPCSRCGYGQTEQWIAGNGTE